MGKDRKEVENDKPVEHEKPQKKQGSRFKFFTIGFFLGVTLVISALGFAFYAGASSRILTFSTSNKSPKSPKRVFNVNQTNDVPLLTLVDEVAGGVGRCATVKDAVRAVSTYINEFVALFG